MLTSKVLTRVSLSVPGFHAWKSAPDAVGFLRDRHRHMFGITVEFAGDLNRGVEFFIGRQAIEEALIVAYHRDGLGFDFGYSSCEMIGVTLAAIVDSRFKVAAVEVSEDGENSGRVEFV